MVKQSGFTLLEVMVAVVILAIGLLGMAALQAISIRNNHSAYLRTQATLQAYDMMDRMRANMRAVGKGISAGAGNGYNSVAGVAVATCLAAGCDATQMAQNDLFEWNSANAVILPDGAGVVCIDSTPADGTPASPACDNVGVGTEFPAPYAIKIWWTDDRSGNLQQFVTSFRP